MPPKTSFKQANPYSYLPLLQRIPRITDIPFRTVPPSREHGLLDHVNCLVWERLPKRTCFRQMPAQVKAVQERLNTRPGRAPGYLISVRPSGLQGRHKAGLARSGEPGYASFR